ncbi:hypothetical protein [Clostridium septicum]|nr:hypothetical protein [Clostridium septicum]
MIRFKNKLVNVSENGVKNYFFANGKNLKLLFIRECFTGETEL